MVEYPKDFYKPKSIKVSDIEKTRMVNDMIREGHNSISAGDTFISSTKMLEKVLIEVCEIKMKVWVPMDEFGKDQEGEE